MNTTRHNGGRGKRQQPDALRNSGWRPPLIDGDFAKIKVIAKEKGLTPRQAVEEALTQWMTRNG